MGAGAGDNKGLSLGINDLLSGTMGGVAQVLSGHPLDTVKVRMQSASAAADKRGMGQIFTETFRQEGLAGLYKGATSPLAGAMLHNAAVFFSYGIGKRLVCQFNGKEFNESAMTIPEIWYSGALVGATVSIFEGPIDLLKSKVQAQWGKGIYKGPFDCAKKIVAQRGPRALWQGFFATELRNIPCFASYFASFEATKRHLASLGWEYKLWWNFVGGMAAGFFFWGVFYPLDIIKTRMQTDAVLPADRKYRNTAHCVSKMFKDEGASAFFRGYTPSLIRALFVNGCIFYAVMAAKQFLQKAA